MAKKSKNASFNSDTDDTGICCLCGDVYVNGGNNPYPLVKDKDAWCCDMCKGEVFAARMAEFLA